MPRFPAEVTIIVPALTTAQLKTLVNNFNTLQAAPDNIVVRRQDQMGEATMTLRENWEPDTSQASNTAITETKVGLEASLTLSLRDDSFDVFTRFFNAVITEGTGTDVPLAEFRDQGGCSYGEDDLPYTTVILRPYACNNPIIDPRRWMIFPRAGIKADSTLTYGLGTQWSYNINITAYPLASGTKVMKGDPARLPA